MAITDESKEKLKARLAKAIGHLNAVYRMVDEKKYCIDVLHQLKAVQSALDKTSEVILRQHLETCVVEAVKNQDSERVIDELIQVFKKLPIYTFSKKTRNYPTVRQKLAEAAAASLKSFVAQTNGLLTVLRDERQSVLPWHNFGKSRLQTQS